MIFNKKYKEVVNCDNISKFLVTNKALDDIESYQNNKYGVYHENKKV